MIVAPSDAQASDLIFDPDLVEVPGHYSIGASPNAIELPRCSRDSPTTYHGVLATLGSSCVHVWLFDGSLLLPPVILRWGVGADC